MSLCAVTLDWADGSYTFALPIAQLEELQTHCDAGPLVIARRLEEGAWRSQDIHQTIRLGLIGGGTAPPVALRLVKTYVHERPLLENVLPALAILQGVLIGKPDEPAGKSQADGEDPSDPPAPTESSTSATSTDSAA